MQLTVKIKLLPTAYQEKIINSSMQEYIKTVNALVKEMTEKDSFLKLTSKYVSAELPAALRTQCIRDAQSVFKKHRKTKLEHVLKKPIAIWNNRSYRILDNELSFPVFIDGITQRLKVKAIITSEDLLRLNNSSKLGAMRITQKNNKLIAQIAIKQEIQQTIGHGVIGIDLGLKCPAVCASNNGKILFAGNGRKNKYIRRHYKAKRRELGKAKKSNAIKNLNDKEHRIMQEIDHKISRQVINFAIENKAHTIKLERLENIRSTAKTSRKNEHNLHTWSFYRLAQYIEYKAKMAGMTVEYINPAYTSQRCPACGELHHAKDRLYKCSCGIKLHRDLVGALNILRSPVADGNSPSALVAICTGRGAVGVHRELGVALA